MEFLKGGAEGRWPRVGPSYAELTIQMRQRSDADAQEYRHDLAPGQWFGGEAPSALADEAWGQVLLGVHNEYLRFEEWDSPTEVFERLKRLLVEEVDEISDIDDQTGFGESLGGVHSNGNVYFNHSSENRRGAGSACEKWQVLSPIHATGAGVAELNRSIHRHFRAEQWYADSGVKEGGGDIATLIVTQDDERGGIDSAEVQAKVREIA